MARGAPDRTLSDVGELGASEIIIRVAQFDFPAKGQMVPARWQATVRHHDETLPWSVAVGSDPDKALAEALLKFPVKADPTPPKVDDEWEDLI